jgi:hypothetical protein
MCEGEGGFWLLASGFWLLALGSWLSRFHPENSKSGVVLDKQVAPFRLLSLRYGRDDRGFKR